MAYEQELLVRFEDVDYAQIVYFPRIFGYCHRVFEDFFAREAGVSYAELLKERRTGFPVVHARADFQSPLAFGDRCRVVMETLKIGRTSVTHRYRLYVEGSGRLAAEIELVTVVTHLDTLKPMPVPPEARGAFERHLARVEEAR